MRKNEHRMVLVFCLFTGFCLDFAAIHAEIGEGSGGQKLAALTGQLHVDQTGGAATVAHFGVCVDGAAGPNLTGTLP